MSAATTGTIISKGDDDIRNRVRQKDELRIKKEDSLIRNPGKQEITVRKQRQTGKKRGGIGSRDSK